MGGKLKSREDVIKDFKEIWGDFYDYSEMEYLGWNKKIRIICPIHGPFEQNCNAHRRHGCPACGHNKNAAAQRGSVSYDFEEFVKRANKIHNNFYTYPEQEWKGTGEKVRIVCPIHGEFEQRACNHLLKHGCKECRNNNNRKMHKERTVKFIEDFKNIVLRRGDITVLDGVKKSSDKVRFLCHNCGEVFVNTPNYIQQGQGCPNCAKSGFKPNLPAVIYVMVDDLEVPEIMKIGISQNLPSRLRCVKRQGGFDTLEVARVWHFSFGRDARKKEEEIHKIFGYRNCHFKGFDGCTEFFWYTPEVFELLEDVE